MSASPQAIAITAITQAAVDTMGIDATKQPEMLELLRLHHDERPPMPLVLHTLNLDDGIGDFRHLLDFYGYYDDSHFFNVKGLCAITPEKLGLARIFLEDSFGPSYRDEVYIYNIKDAFDPELAQQARITICVFEHTNHGYAQVSAQLRQHYQEVLPELLEEYTASVGVSFALPLPLTDHTDFMFEEYGMLSRAGGEILLCESTQPHLFDNYETGTVYGVKLYPRIIAAADPASDFALPETLTAAQLEVLSHDADEHPAFGIGYLQRLNTITTFLLVNMAEQQADTVNVIMDMTMKRFEALRTELEKRPELKALLQEAGIRNIVYTDQDNQVHRLTISPDASTARDVCIAALAGMSEADKQQLIAKATVVAGSGDSSFSETLSNEHCLPFFTKKEVFIRDIASTAKKLQLKLLESYFNMLSSLSRDRGRLNVDKLRKLYQFIRENRTTLKEQYAELCKYIKEERNVLKQVSRNQGLLAVTDFLKSASIEQLSQFLTLMNKPFLNSARHTDIALFAAKYRPEILEVLVNIRPEFMRSARVHELIPFLLNNPKHKAYLSEHPGLVIQLCNALSSDDDIVFSENFALILNTFPGMLTAETIVKIVSGDEEKFEYLLSRWNASFEQLEAVVRCLLRDAQNTTVCIISIKILSHLNNSFPRQDTFEINAAAVAALRAQHHELLNRYFRAEDRLRILEEILKPHSLWRHIYSQLDLASFETLMGEVTEAQKAEQLSQAKSKYRVLSSTKIQPSGPAARYLMKYRDDIDLIYRAIEDELDKLGPEQEREMLAQILGKENATALSLMFNPEILDNFAAGYDREETTSTVMPMYGRIAKTKLVLTEEFKDKVTSYSKRLQERFALLNYSHGPRPDSTA